MSDDTTDIQSTATPSAEPIPSPTSELPTAPTKTVEPTPRSPVPPILVAPPPPPITAPKSDVVLIAPPVERRFDGLRLRMKVWTDPKTKKRYLVPTAVLTDMRRGIFTVYAMTDEDTRQIQLGVDEWNALPFFHFKEDGPAPRGAPRAPDVVDVKK
jgi:hypothetical protein